MLTPFPEGFTPTTIIPPIAHLEYRFLLPQGWHQVETPPAQPDFDDPAAFMPLGVFIHEPTVCVFSVAARPAYSDGTVLQWLQYLAGQQQFAVESYEPFQLEVSRGASCIAVQEKEGDTPMKMRVVAFEDDKSLITLVGMAPLESWPAHQPLLEKVISSFFLRTARGPTVPLAPDELAPEGQ